MGDHPLDVAARAAYEAFRLVTTESLDMPPWDDIPPGAREHWRAVADAVQMITGLRDGDARRAERARLFEAIRRAIKLDVPWRGEALDLITEVWRKTEAAMPP